MAEADLPDGIGCSSSTERAFARRRGGGEVANPASAIARQVCGASAAKAGAAATEVGAAAAEAGAAAAGERRAAMLPRDGAPRLGKLASEGLARSAEAGRRAEAGSSDASLEEWKRPWAVGPALQRTAASEGGRGWWVGKEKRGAAKAHLLSGGGGAREEGPKAPAAPDQCKAVECSLRVHDHTAVLCSAWHMARAAPALGCK